MKRLFASIFIALILFNVMGYYGLFLGLQYNNAREMMKIFDEGRYDQRETQTFKIPFKAHSSASSETFERLDGDFERDGQVYRIIKSRLFRDTFHIVYIKDKTGTAINKAFTDYVKTFIEHSSGHGSIAVKPHFIKEYFAKATLMQSTSAGWEHGVRKESRSTIFISTFTPSIVHPPERG